ncbi:hypothetical protein CR203_12295 [Salipaludibacillus neizhouensis]|uniref:Transcription regulator PadR N-terminal domain-containing protein n=1 Tax=Salipaludibacillus neizhouensis TaxID=885475 RepID=A0A3A9K735_9BACI|nr:PadR family transcriptional regulator [Salipaludibacillus neizhouensis]RKL67278.1 hypothetical protein CR203_12295 [Salipaludibacillus neizhouensis]
MNDPFTKLKSSMKNTIFKDLSFSDEQKKAVKHAIREDKLQPQLHFWKEETLLDVFEFLQREANHGYEISNHLFQKYDQSFQNNQGQLYTLLHLLENKELLTSKWIEEKKYYSLTAKGKKQLAAYTQGSSKHGRSFKLLLEEAVL